jgi:hypothetical protein
MAPGAIQNENQSTHGASGLKATAREFHPLGATDASRYHAASSNEAITAEAEFAAHNYHPLPIGMQGGLPATSDTDNAQSLLERLDAPCGTLRASTI